MLLEIQLYSQDYDGQERPEGFVESDFRLSTITKWNNQLCKVACYLSIVHSDALLTSRQIVFSITKVFGKCWRDYSHVP